MSKKLKTYSWRKKLQNLVDEQIDTQSFQDDVKSNDKSELLRWLDITRKYQLPLSSYRYVNEYIRTGKKHPELLRAPVRIVSEKDKSVEPAELPEFGYSLQKSSENMKGRRSRLYLEITEKCTITDLEHFIRDNRDLIRDKMELFDDRPTYPIRQTRFAKRDDEIFESYNKGEKIPDIAERESLSPQYVRMIISRLKLKRNL